MENIQNFKDKLKQSFYNKIGGKEKKLKTSMQSLILQLELKNLLPKNMKAIEVFGMHGLWHTKDYIHLVDELDIFEINKKYHDLSKKNLKKFKVNYFLQDSIKFIAETENKYDLVVADIPFGGDFYSETGLPRFIDDLIKISKERSILIFNMHSKFLKDYQRIQSELILKSKDKKVIDLFFIARNSEVSYVVVAFG